MPIIDKELWDQVHSIYTTNSIKPKRVIKRQHLLTGLLKCPQCGKSMVQGHANSIRKDGSIHINHYYVCSAYNAKGPTVCRGNSTRAEEIEQWFLHNLQQLLCSSSVLDRIVASAQSKLDINLVPRQEKLLELRTKLIQLDSRQKESFQSFENGAYSNEQLLLELNEIKNLRQTTLCEQEDMERELITQPDITIPKEKIHAALQQLQHVLKMASFDRQKRTTEYACRENNLATQTQHSRSSDILEILLSGIQKSILDGGSIYDIFKRYFFFAKIMYYDFTRRS